MVWLCMATPLSRPSRKGPSRFPHPLHYACPHALPLNGSHATPHHTTPHHTSPHHILPHLTSPGSPVQARSATCGQPVGSGGKQRIGLRSPRKKGRQCRPSGADHKPYRTSSTSPLKPRPCTTQSTHHHSSPPIEPLHTSGCRPRKTVLSTIKNNRGINPLHTSGCRSLQAMPVSCISCISCESASLVWASRPAYAALMSALQGDPCVCACVCVCLCVCVRACVCVLFVGLFVF